MKRILSAVLVLLVSTVGNAYSLHDNNLVFIENKGQVHDAAGKPMPSILFSLKAPGMHISLSRDGIHYLFIKGQEKKTDAKELLPNTQPYTIETYRLDVTLVGANPDAVVTAEDKQEYYENYYLPGCGDNGITNVHSYKKIVYHNVYPSVDWVVYTKATDGNAKGVKYDFIVHPGGNPKDIQLQYSGGDLKLNKEGGIEATTPLGKITEDKPYAYIKETGKEQVCRFIAKNNKLSFETGVPAETLVIDPVIDWSTYYGGSVSEQSPSVRCDILGNIYMAGWSSSASSIATTGSFLSVFSGGLGSDAFLVKFNSSGSRLWATYYGGSNNDQGYSVSCSGVNAIYLSGQTQSTAGITTPGSAQSSYAGGLGDIFLAKFDGSGLRQWATYFGGSGDDMYGFSACDDMGNVYITGVTNSTTGIATIGSQQPIYAGGTYDGFLVKFNTLGQKQWATYYGDTGTENSYAVALDNYGHVYISGSTNSGSGIATSNGFQTVYNNSSGPTLDAFLVQFNSVGSRLWGTYYGSNGDDIGFAVSCDHSGNVYLGGNTLGGGSNMVTAGSYQTTYAGGSGDMFLAKFNIAGARQWATYYGGSNAEACRYLACDILDNVFIAGNANSTTGIATPGSPQPTFAGGSQDAILVKFDSSGARKWGTYLGGTNSDFAYSVCSDNLGDVYISGYTLSTSGIATPGSHQSAYGGVTDALLAKYIDTLAVLHQYNSTLHYCRGDSVHIHFTATGIFHSTNIFTAQLSDNLGSFTGPTVLGTLPGTNGGTISALLPLMPPGTGYKIRVVSSLPVIISDTVTVSIDTNVTPTIVITASDTTVCTGTLVNFIATIVNGGTFPQYQWKLNGATAGSNSPVYASSSLANGDKIYCVLTSNAVCAAPATVKSDTITMVVYPLPAPVITRAGNVLSTTAYSSYQWYRNTVLIIGATSQSYILTQNGNYQVEVTDANGCKGKSAIMSVENLSVGSTSVNTEEILIYPNPANDKIFIDSKVLLSCMIFNMQGQIIMKTEAVNEIDIKSLADGVYLINLLNKTGARIKTERLVKMCK